MNNERRKKISDIISALEQLMDDIQTVKDEEQEAFDAMPESLQGSDRGQASEAAISALEGIDLESIIGELETAKE